jgi:hypothetical protein
VRGGAGGGFCGAGGEGVQMAGGVGGTAGHARGPPWRSHVTRSQQLPPTPPEEHGLLHMLGDSGGHTARPPRQSQQWNPSVNQSHREPSKHSSTPVSPLVAFVHGHDAAGCSGDGGADGLGGDGDDGGGIGSAGGSSQHPTQVVQLNARTTS